VGKKIHHISCSAAELYYTIPKIASGGLFAKFSPPFRRRSSSGAIVWNRIAAAINIGQRSKLLERVTIKRLLYEPKWTAALQPEQ
jgi:hypothetical protein